MNSLKWIVPTALVVCAVPLVAGWQSSPTADKTLTAAQIRGALNGMNLKFTEDKDAEDKTMFIIDTEGTKSILLMYGGEGDVASSVMISTQWNDKIALDKLNEWNRDMRFTKCYATEDDGIAFEADLDLSASPSQPALKKFIEVYLDQMPTFAEAVTK